jgi:hypothetical protein
LKIQDKKKLVWYCYSSVFWEERNVEKTKAIRREDKSDSEELDGRWMTGVGEGEKGRRKERHSG